MYVKGYYSSNGSVRAVTNSNKSSAKGTVKSTEVATAKYPS